MEISSCNQSNIKKYSPLHFRWRCNTMRPRCLSHCTVTLSIFTSSTSILSLPFFQDNPFFSQTSLSLNYSNHQEEQQKQQQCKEGKQPRHPSILPSVHPSIHSASNFRGHIIHTYPGRNLRVFNHAKRKKILQKNVVNVEAAPLLQLFMVWSEVNENQRLGATFMKAEGCCVPDLCFVVPSDWSSSPSPWWSSWNMLLALWYGMLNVTEPSFSSLSKEWLATVSKPLRE